jgi:hypothetical protein
MAETKGRNTTVRVETGRCDDGIDVKSQMGGKMGGGRDNLAHSLSGASAVQRGK